MASKDLPLSELLLQDPDPIVDLTSPLNSVDVSTKDRIVIQEELEKRLKQRAGRQDLVERNILPPFSLPTASKLFINSQQLHRAQIVDNLQKKMRNRPRRDNLLQMNILPDLQVNLDPALTSKQLQLKKSKLADALNDKLANRPGPLQLLQDGIIEPTLSKAVKGYEMDQPAAPPLPIEGPSTSSEVGKLNFSSVPEISLQSSDGLNSEGLPVQRHSIAGMSPSTDLYHMDTSPGPAETMPSFSGDIRKFSDSSISPAPSPGGSLDEARSPEKSPRAFNSTYPPLLKSSISAGVLSTMTKSPLPSSTRKKQKKKYRKLRYHEYVPPSKSTPKGGKTNPKTPSKSDSPYSALLQQQQLFLQLQVLQQQYPNGVLMQKLPEMINTMSKDQKALAIAAVKGRISVTSPSDIPLNRQSSLPQIQILPVDMPNKHNASTVRFEELKVNDLKASCKEMGMIVSGKKADLVERLMDCNKGMLPASSLPDNPIKDNHRQAFSLGHMSSSVDSQFSTSSTLSPTSPTSSPVFKFPSDRASHESTITTSAGGGASCTVTKQHPGLVQQLPDVFPSPSLHKEFNDIIERQKRQYICQKGISEKSIAPRPELAELLALKLLPPTYPTSTSSSAPATQVEQRPKGGTMSSGGGRVVVSRSQLIKSDKSSSGSLPPSPKPSSSPSGQELMEPSSLPGTDLAQNTFISTSTTSFSNSTSSSESYKNNFSSVPNLGVRDVQILNSSSQKQMGGGVTDTLSLLTRGGIATSYYQQQQTSSLLENSSQANVVRPERSSVPAQSSHPGPSSHSSVGLPPTYNSVMRSRSIVGTHPNMAGMMPLHNGVSYGGGVATPPNEYVSKAMTPELFVPDGVDMAMDTGESSISDIFDILRAEEYSHSSHPMSLPVLSGSQAPQPPKTHSSLPQTPHYGDSPTKLNASLHHQESSQSVAHNLVLGNIMPFGNPPLSSLNKSGSDMCLNMGESRDGQKNSIGSSGMYGPSNLILSNELNWLDLDNTSGLGLSPTSNNTFGNLNSHSNPGSLPHEQFQSSFIEDSMSSQMVMMGGGMTKNSNPAVNGFGMGVMQSFMEPGLMPQSSLYSTTDEESLLELGLSTS